MDFTKVLNIASDNDKRKLEELRIRKMRNLKMKNGGSLVKTDAIKSFLQKKEMEKRKIEIAESKRRDELLNLRAAAKNNRKATAMAKRTKDNNFLRNAQEADDRTLTREKDENKTNALANRTTGSARNDKSRFPIPAKLDHVERPQKLQQSSNLGKPERNRIPMKTPVKSENVKSVISVKTYNNAKFCQRNDKRNLDFNSLMKLAKTKQYEPIVIESKPKPKPDTESRLMTQSERERFNEEQTRKFNVNPNKSAVGLKSNKPKPKITEKKAEATRKPEMNKTKTELIKNKTEVNKSKIQKLEVRQKINPQQMKNSQIPPNAKLTSAATVMKRPLPPAPKPTDIPRCLVKKPAELHLPPTKKPRIEPVKLERLSKPRPLEKRPLPRIGHVMSPRRPMGPPKSRFPVGPIRRRLESDEDDYDDEMNDFIDDGPGGTENEDYSQHIREIFGYDRRRYALMDEDADCMESSFARQMQEEAYSARVGLLEDLEDIRKEQEELERKYKSKKKKK